MWRKPPKTDKRIFNGKKWKPDFHVNPQKKGITAGSINCHYIYWNLENN